MDKLLLTLYFIFLAPSPTESGFYVPHLPSRRYVQEGDINLGALFPISSYSTTKACGDGLRSTSILQFVEALVYSVNEINNNSNILPNITLGFAILDDCLKETTTIAQSLSFVPEPQSCQETCANNTKMTSTPRYDVVGVVGSLKSSNSIAAASLLGPIQIPQVSYSSTSDELSNKELYPYFLRVVPPDEFQAEAIVGLIAHYSWSYISIVYTEGSYGELGYKNIKRLTDSRGICIGSANMVSEGSGSKDYTEIAKDLLDNLNARVVIVFAGPTQTKGLFTALKELGLTNYFIFIGSDAWAKRIKLLGDVWDVGLGAFTVSFYSREDPLYTDYFKTIRPEADVRNPWFREFWGKHFKCSFDSVISPCNVDDVLSFENGFKAISTVTPVMDAVSTFAKAIDSLLKDNCPLADSATARDCISGPLLLEYLKNTTFSGRNGLIRFDANGNALGSYIIDQLITGSPYAQGRVATYDAFTKQLTMDGEVTFEHVTNFGTHHPESICSRQCGIGEFLIQQELSCCWLCKSCRSNEMVTNNGTSCESCPMFEWPELETDLKSCSPIPPVTIDWSEPFAIMLVTFSFIGIVLAISILVFYIKYNESSFIKASSRDLSYFMLTGVCIGYLTVFGMVTKPETWSCKMVFFCFCISFTCIYGPLLTRTIRIYRIFESGKKSNKRPRFIGSKTQIVIAMLFVFGQVAISIVFVLWYSPEATRTMQVPTQKYVELSCNMPLAGLISFLSYNILLVLTCTYFAFRTRKLPDNFNESRFISMCVYTTLVIWLAFIPTYFTAGREYLKTVSLAIALILNSTVVLLFLYLPKIYATIYLLEHNSRVFSKATRSFNLTTMSGQSVNKIEPVSVA
ncbi:hypothetical protein LOTGIDRAFT_145056 [Lottia gigantea]|uniref:G-protein coupled receptors family 3 profile domain-containing protein n=1 Tax=Lottia gigantea TaxID=225164 RepID=V4AGY8_LOTGI|nr:hypothetical protein LOTGIDRAFT_145056 [Lottia gigantea]ESO94405.1 hypothetical protein LOTGIDRAFT_145056 [Lottia gigantea]